MLVYDVTDERSFRNIPRWIQKIEQLARPDVQTLLIANKCDLTNDRLISKERGERLAKHLAIRHREISALSNLNVEDAFGVLLRKVFRQACSNGETAESWAEQTVVHEQPQECINLTCCTQ